MIHVLDQKTIDKIAAGEVIERPASIVKELVENSIDAGADRVTVEIKDGGISFIRVTDNGSGIPGEEVQKAFMRHATSKLRDAADLAAIGTLGFRGEALSTISAVTETEMITKPRESLTGIKYVISGGTELECTEIGAPDGTTIVSRNIFFNTPARLKFLKSPMTEGSYISDLMSHIALSHPEVAVRLINNGKTVLDTTGNGNLKDTVYTLYGKDITGSLLPVDYEESGLKISGFIGKPFLSRGNRSFENYFVNSRYIKSPVINRAIEEAYKTYIMQHRFPFTVLYLTLPREECDVNVHPTKREFKYQNEKALFSVVLHGILNVLKENSHIPDMNTDYGIREKIYKGNPDLMSRDNKATSQAGSVKKTYDSAAGSTVFQVSEPGRSSGISQISEYVRKDDISQISAPGRFNGNPRTSEHIQNNSLSKISESGRTNGSFISHEPAPRKSTGDSYSILEALMPKDFREKLQQKEEIREAEEKKQQEITEKKEAEEQLSFRQAQLTDDNYLSKEAEPEVTVIGLAFDTYWITQYKDTLYLMDQHAAHEKVNYERFLAEFKQREIHSQKLFPPKIITLSAAEKEAVVESFSLLEKSGFEIEDFGGNEIKLSALPVNLLGLSGEDVFMELVAYISAGIEGVTEDIFVRKLATMGCKAAVKGNQRISFHEVQVLLKELLTLENPYTCPHGRPTIIRMTKEDLDRKFKRIT